MRKHETNKVLGSTPGNGVFSFDGNCQLEKLTFSLIFRDAEIISIIYLLESLDSLVSLMIISCTFLTNNENARLDYILC
jgi:hypothetical protein